MRFEKRSWLLRRVTGLEPAGLGEIRAGGVVVRVEAQRDFIVIDRRLGLAEHEEALPRLTCAAK